MKLLAVVSLYLAACGPAARPSPQPVRTPQPQVAKHAPEPWVPVATYGNPALFPNVPEDRIVALMTSHGIEWAAGGSLGYTLNVPASRADEARALLRGDPQLAAFVSVQ